MVHHSALYALTIAITVLFQSPVSHAQGKPLEGAQLYSDVKRYADFGIHRFGTDGDRATTEWIAAELGRAGFAVSFQQFSLGKQYFLDRGTITVDGDTFDAAPAWWPPEDKASFALDAPIASESGDASNKIVLLSLPNDSSAYLGNAQKKAIAEAARRNPKAIVLTIENPGESIYAYNVAQDDPPWPVPVIVVASKERERLERARRNGSSLSISISGKYERDVAGRNVIGTLNRNAGRTVVVSTPMTGWFTCACERGSGIAAFIALARKIGAMQPNVNFVFVATAGHEIGHGGMETFLSQHPPRPSDTLAWIHIGASIACYQWNKADKGWVTDKTVDPHRWLISSASAAALTGSAFGGQTFTHVVTDKTPPGELRDVYAAKYPNFFGIAAGHRFFHSPEDTPATTGPEILEPVTQALAKAVTAIVDKGDAAFTADGKR